MLPSLIIMYREALEVSLIVGILISYLIKTKQTKYIGAIHIGLAAGILTSVILAFIFSTVFKVFSGRNEEIFEGVLMFIGAGLLTSMILWMLRQKNISQKLREQADKSINRNSRLGIFLLVYVSVLREGIETVIFLSSAEVLGAGGYLSLLGAVIGLLFAVATGFILFVTTIRINLTMLFRITSIILILFAAGLIAHGVHELEEAHVLPEIYPSLWNTNHIINEKSFFGEILKGLFGYNGNPSLSEVLAYIIYLVIVTIAYTGKVNWFYNPNKYAAPSK